MSGDNITEVQKLVETLIKHENLELNTVVMKEIKQLCKLSVNNVSHSFYQFMTHLKKENSEVRYIVLLGMNELFLRSFAFRKLVERNLEEFLELVLETNPDKSLPPPKAVANRLKLKAQHIVKDWHNKFADSCKTLRNAYSFLRTYKKIDFDCTAEGTSSENLNQRRIQRNHELMIAEKVNKAEEEMANLSEEIVTVLQQIENCFQLIVPLPDDLFDSDDFAQPSTSQLSFDRQDSNNDVGVEMTESLRGHGIFGIKASLSIQINKPSSVTVEKNKDNESVLETAQNLYRQISEVYLAMVSKWLKIFMKGQGCLSSTKKAIDLKQSLEAAISKYKELNIKEPSNVPVDKGSDSSTDSSDFEEVEEKEGYERFAFESDSVQNMDCTSTEMGKNKTAKSCCAPLPSGKLCPRQDKYKCPFHGKIVERDKYGVPLHQTPDLAKPSTSKELVPEWQDPELLADIKAATGVDLKLTKKGKRKTAKTSSTASRPNVKAPQSTAYSRLYKKIFKKQRGRSKKC